MTCVHHRTPFSQGGRTSVENGTMLCGRHHRHVHATGMVSSLVRGQVVWTTKYPRPPGAPARTRATVAVERLARRWGVRQRE
ncbi:HNH endonuclease signature motif containing protein [Angustibacter peucedani]